MRVRWQRRAVRPLRDPLLAVTASAVVATALFALTLAATGHAPVPALHALFSGALGDRDAIFESLVRGTPLMLTGLATCVAFRARVWNIGQEGQFVLGAVAAWVAAAALPAGTPALVVIPFALVIGAGAGVALGGVAGWLSARRGVNELISTVMLNYIVYYFLTYLLSGPLQQKPGYHLKSSLLGEHAWLPVLVDASRLHLGFLVALACIGAAHFMFTRTSFGFALRAFGHNPQATRMKGVDTAALTVTVMAISGGLAGLAGATELLGVHQRLTLEIQSGLGFSGILVAMLGGLTPLGTLAAAFCFGALANGGLVMQVTTGVPVALVQSLQAVLLLLFLTTMTLTRWSPVLERRHALAG